MIWHMHVKTKKTCLVLLLLYLSSGVMLAVAYLPFLHLFFPLLTFLSLRPLSPVSNSFYLLPLFSILLPLFQIAFSIFLARQ